MTIFLGNDGDGQGTEVGAASSTQRMPDNANQMTSAEHRAGNGTLLMHADYAYDVFGNRLAKSVRTGPFGTPVVTRFAYDDGGNLWADLNVNNNLLTRYVGGDQTDQLFARISSGGAVAWYLPDHLGSVRDLTDNTGTVQDHIDYDAFGIVIFESTASFGDRYKYTGRESDIETGLQYNRARYYDPKTGRWMAKDPIGFRAGDANLYRYVRNGPTNGTDPTGDYKYTRYQGDEIEIPDWFVALSKDVSGQVGLYEWVQKYDHNDFKKFDRNNDGFITFQEMADYVKGHDNQQPAEPSPSAQAMKQSDEAARFDAGAGRIRAKLYDTQTKGKNTLEEYYPTKRADLGTLNELLDELKRLQRPGERDPDRLQGIDEAVNDIIRRIHDANAALEKDVLSQLPKGGTAGSITEQDLIEIQRLHDEIVFMALYMHELAPAMVFSLDFLAGATQGLARNVGRAGSIGALEEGVGAAGNRSGLRAAESWGRPETLAKHFGDHGADFGATSAENYAQQASRFLQESQARRLPTKIDSEGIIRVYDPKTNTFGSYNPDGTTRTFFKPQPRSPSNPRGHSYPTNEAYWNAQEGNAPWTP